MANKYCLHTILKYSSGRSVSGKRGCQNTLYFRLSMIEITLGDVLGNNLERGPGDALWVKISTKFFLIDCLHT